MATKVTDRSGNEYTLEITLRTVRDIRSRTAFDLLNEEDFKVLIESLTKRIDIAWELCRKQALDRSPQVSEDLFFDNLSAPGIPDAFGDAVLDELLFFYRSLGVVKLATIAESVAKGLRNERETWGNPETQEKVLAAISGVLSPNSQQ